MSTQVTQTDDEANDHKSEYVETKNGWATVWADHVEGTDVWITEHIVDEPEGATKPHTVRCAWRVHEIGQKHWIVVPVKERRLFNGCANGRRTSTFDAHVQSLKSELNYHYLIERSNATSSENLEIEFEL